MPDRAAARGRRRLRADLGDRHRPDRDARAGAGGGRVRARARGGLRQGRRPGGADPLRRLAEARQRGRAAGAARRRRRAGRRRQPRPESFARDRRGARGVRDAVRRPAVAWSSSTAGGSRPTGRATRSRSPTRRCSTSSGRSTRTRTLTAMGASVGLPEGQMGNSEVGHLNLGAGAIVPQDLARIDEAVEDGSLAENEVLRAALRDAAARAPDRARLRRRRALVRPPPEGADRARRASGAWRTSSSTPSPTAATRSPTGGRRVPRRRSRAGCEEAAPAAIGTRHRPLLRDGPRQALGPHPEGASTCSWTARPSTTPTAARRPPRPPTSATRPTSSSRRRRSARRRAIRPGDSVIAFNFRPDRMRQITEALTQGGRRPLHDADGVRGGLDLPGRLPARAARRSRSRKVIAERGETQLHVAETEKYPHVTYFFNGGEEEPVRGRGARARALPARRPDLRPQAGDERARGDRRVRRALGAGRRRRSRSSTSPTPTWSATPA